MHLVRRVLVTIRSGYARFEHDNCSFRSRPAEGVNSPVALPRGYLRWSKKVEKNRMLLHKLKIIVISLRICARRRAISRVAHRTDNSVVTLLGLPSETSQGWGFNPTTTQSADYPCEIGSIAPKVDIPMVPARVLCRGEAPRPGRLRTRSA